MISGFSEGTGGVFLLFAAAAFPIVNPAASALIFLDITRHLSHRAREALARRIAVYSFLVLNVSLYVGNYLLDFFGISIPVLRVAGGIVVAAAGWRFLQEPDKPAEGEDEAAEAEKTPSGDFLGMAFYPLTLPITTGPGTISVMIALGSSHPATGGLGGKLQFVAGASAANAVLAVTIYFCFAFADRVRRLLGNAGTTVLMRLAAFILLCIGIQITWTGISELIRSLDRG
jgi:multiple antibiotic resistance protein